MKRLHPIALCLFMVSLVGLPACSMADTDGGPREALETNKKRWNELGYTDYEFDLTRHCFCGFFGTHQVRVQADTIVSVFSEETGENLEASYFADLETIDALFRTIDQALTQEADKLSVTYHPTLGYPTEIDIDYFFNAVDDEVIYGADNLKPNR
jgi:hypothetical protein